MKRGSMRRCGRCRERGHSAKKCPRNPENTFRQEVPAQLAEILLRRLRPFLRACSWDENVLHSLMLSCYLQGALDAQFLRKVPRR